MDVSYNDFINLSKNQDFSDDHWSRKGLHDFGDKFTNMKGNSNKVKYLRCAADAEFEKCSYINGKYKKQTLKNDHDYRHAAKILDLGVNYHIYHSFRYVITSEELEILNKRWDIDHASQKINKYIPSVEHGRDWFVFLYHNNKIVYAIHGVNNMYSGKPFVYNLTSKNWLDSFKCYLTASFRSFSKGLAAYDM